MKPFLLIIFTFTALFSLQAHSALGIGTPAPDFTAPASLAREEISFQLSDALENGPVVLYFYPAAFTPGCTIEAHEFAEATDEFTEYGATIIGVSADNLGTLNRFSVSECRDKFAVAADPDSSVIRSYDAALARNPTLANRISYVISPQGEIVNVHISSDPYSHINESLNSIKAGWEKIETDE